MNANDEAANYSIRDKWGEALDNGFVVVPSALFRYQYKLGISDGEAVVLMNLFMSWWKVDQLPFPSTPTLAKRMNVTPRTVQRHIERLEEKRLIKRIWSAERREQHRTIARYDLTGIVAELKRLGAIGHQAPPTGTAAPITRVRQAVKPNPAILQIPEPLEKQDGEQVYAAYL